MYRRQGDDSGCFGRIQYGIVCISEEVPIQKPSARLMTSSKHQSTSECSLAFTALVLLKGDCRSLQLRPVPISGMSHISSGWWLSNRTELVLLCIYQALTYYQSTDVVLLGAVALHNVNNEILYTLVTTIDPWSTKCHWGLEGDIQNIRKWFWHQKAARQQVLTNLSVYRIL